MKFYNINNIDEFFKTVEKCKGEVMLYTSEGDCLNLKSQLARIVAYANVFSGGKIPEMEIKCSDPDDMAALVEFVVTKK